VFKIFNKSGFAPSLPSPVALVLPWRISSSFRLWTLWSNL